MAEPRFKWQDAVGILGLLLSVAGWTDMPIILRLVFFGAGAIFVPVSFFSHRDWPLRLRWLLSIPVVAFLGFAGWRAWEASLPKKDVFLEWRQPPPMESGNALTEKQLSAVAKYDGSEVPGTYVYSPTFGSNLPPGMDTLSVEFTPRDPSKFRAARQTIVVLVRDQTKTTNIPASSQPKNKTGKQQAKYSRNQPADTPAPAPARTAGNTQGITISAPVTQTASAPCSGNSVGGSVDNTNCQVTTQQFGPLKLTMSDDVAKAVTKAMKPYAGNHIFLEGSGYGSKEYGSKLFDALRLARMVFVDQNGEVDSSLKFAPSFMIVTSYPEVDGPLVIAGKQREIEARALAKALGVSANVVITDNERPDALTVLIRPNH